VCCSDVAMWVVASGHPRRIGKVIWNEMWEGCWMGNARSERRGCYREGRRWSFLGAVGSAAA
jgi:hypothetical protein